MAKKKDTQPKVIERKLGQHKVKGSPVLGFAHFDENLIEIDPRQTTFSYFDTLIHERMHLLFPDLSETQIKKKSSKLARFLWQNNYRRVEIK